MAADGKYYYDKYVKDLEDYQHYYDVDPYEDTFGLVGRISQFLRKPFGKTNCKFHLFYQIFGMVDKPDVKVILLQIFLLIQTLEIVPY